MLITFPIYNQNISLYKRSPMATAGQCMRTIRILLVDDNFSFLEAAARFLASDTNIEIIGQISSSLDAIQQVGQLQPDLILMDIAMPEVNGLEATRSIKAQPNAPRVIILTLYDNQEYRTASKAVKADGFIAKSEFGAQLLPLIHSMFSTQQA